jgi:hypothetical protein
VIGAGLTLIVLGAVVPLLARAELWRTSLPGSVSRRVVLRWTATGYALNQAIGFRSGDAARVALARRHCGLATSGASVIVFRVVELAALFASASVAAAALGWGAGACWAVAACLAAALALAPLVARRMSPRPWLAPFAQLVARRLARMGALALAAYLLEAALFVGAAYVLGVPLRWDAAVFLVAASTLGQVAAILPANLGTYEATVAGALAAFGYDGAVLWQLPVLTHILPICVTQSRRATT